MEKAPPSRENVTATTIGWWRLNQVRAFISGGTVSIKDGMTKAELVEEVARTTQLTKKHAEIIVNTVFDSIVQSLKEGEKIELRGFGSFRIRNRGSRLGRNPKTGDQVNVPSKKIPYFKPGKELRELLNGS